MSSDETQWSCSESNLKEGSSKRKRYKLRERKSRENVKVYVGNKNTKRKKQLNPTTESDKDSGFATCSGTAEENLFEDLLKNSATNSSAPNRLKDSEDSDASVESISLLQVADHTARPSCNFTVISPFSNERYNVDTNIPQKIDKYVQTASGADLHEVDDQVKKNVNFLSSVIKLRQALSSADTSAKDYGAILREVVLVVDKQTIMEDVDEVTNQTANYIVSVHLEDVVDKSVDILLQWIHGQIQGGWRNFCEFWSFSIKDDVVKLMNQAVDCNLGGARKKVLDFLKGVFNELEETVEDPIQECITSFLSQSCKSVFVVYDMITHAIGRIKGANFEDDDKLYVINATKRMYYSLRLMKELLLSFSCYLDENGIAGIVTEKYEERRSSVLEMWKMNWRTDGANSVADDIVVRYLNVIGEWCGVFDELSSICVKQAPLLSFVAEKCSSITLNVLLKFKQKL